MQLLVNDNILSIVLDKKIDYHITSIYQEAVNLSRTNEFVYLQLDFSNTSYVTVAGAMYLIFISHQIVKIKQTKKIYIETRYIEGTQNVTSTLLNLGFFNILKIYGNFITDNIQEKEINARIEYWKKAIQNPNSNLKSIYWPITTIPRKFGKNFEMDAYNFYNGFFNFFYALDQFGLISNLDNETIKFIEQYFNKAINEATKNVWDHSESWGIASIISNSSTKTSLCLFDFGVGFINSYIKRMGDFERSLQSDIAVINWLFEEGNTSNINTNHGHGLTVLQKFTDLSNGILVINTDSYLIQYSKTKGLIFNQKSYFPGTQIMINF